MPSFMINIVASFLWTNEIFRERCCRLEINEHRANELDHSKKLKKHHYLKTNEKKFNELVKKTNVLIFPKD